MIALRVPMSVVKANCAPYLKLGEPEHRPERMHLDDHEIVSIYGAEYRGIIQYYLLAGDVWRLNRLHWVMLTSMLKTLAAKHRSTVMAMPARTGPPSSHRTDVDGASRSASKEPAGSRWSHSSVAFRYGGKRRRS